MQIKQLLTGIVELPLQNNATIINEVSQFCCSQLLKMLER
jgi:hypothetical protein